MSTLKLLGDSSGYVQLVANTAAQNNTLTLPNVNDTLANVTSPTFYSTNAGVAMVIDANGNLGIGTTSPGTKLAIYDPGTGIGFSNPASGNFNLGLLGGTGSANAYIYNRANAVLYFGTNNNTQMTLDASGNFGIGTTSPSSYGKLAVIASSGNQISFGDSSASSTNNGYINYAGISGALILNAYSTGGNTYQAFYTSNSGTNAERMRIDSSGNVGFGTSSPTGYGTPNLQINGTNPLIRFTTPTSGTASGNGTQMGQNGLDFSIVNFQAGTLQFWTAVTERMRIDSSGNLLVGTTTSAGSLTNTAYVTGGIFSSVNGSLAGCATGTSYTIITLPTTVVRSYLLTVTIPNADQAQVYNTLYFVRQAGNNTYNTVTALVSASGVSVTISSLTISASQSSGATQTITWNLLRIQ